MWRSRQSEDRERQDLGHMALLGSWVECFGVLGLRPDWLTQTRKHWVLVSSEEAVIKGCTSRKPWEVGRLLITEAIGEVI